MGRELRDQCRAQGVAFFFKQWGGRKKAGDASTGEPGTRCPKAINGLTRWPPAAKQSWGFWTQSKLQILEDYLAAFLTASTRGRARGAIYLDAFAGEGRRSGPDLPPTSSLTDRHASRSTPLAQAEPRSPVLRFFETADNLATQLETATAGLRIQIAPSSVYAAVTAT